MFRIFEDSSIGSRHQFTPRTPTKQNRRVSARRVTVKICRQQSAKVFKSVANEVEVGQRFRSRFA